MNVNVKPMAGIVLLATLAWFPSAAGASDAEAKPLVFGSIAVSKASEIKATLAPLMAYLGEAVGREVVFETGRDYVDTIEKFRSGYFNLGYIGPSPYIIATSTPESRDAFQIIAGLETDHEPYYYTVIIAGKDDASVNAIADIRGKNFAFGSRQSTLSCYLPCKMLMDAGIFDTLESYDFLGRHDKVVLYVSHGKFAAGGIKEAVAKKALDKIKVIAKSDPVYDFMLVAHKTMPAEMVARMRAAALNLKDPKILESIKPGVTGFIETDDANYDNLRRIMRAVDERLGPPK